MLHEEKIRCWQKFDRGFFWSPQRKSNQFSESNLPRPDSGHSRDNRNGSCDLKTIIIIISMIHEPWRTRSRVGVDLKGFTKIGSEGPFFRFRKTMNVLFKNVKTKSMWISSSFHPSSLFIPVNTRKESRKDKRMLPVPLSPIWTDLLTYQFRQQQATEICQSSPSIVDNKSHMLLNCNFT